MKKEALVSCFLFWSFPFALLSSPSPPLQPTTVALGLQLFLVCAREGRAQPFPVISTQTWAWSPPNTAEWQDPSLCSPLRARPERRSAPRRAMPWLARSSKSHPHSAPLCPTSTHCVELTLVPPPSPPPPSSNGAVQHWVLPVRRGRLLPCACAKRLLHRYGASSTRHNPSQSLSLSPSTDTSIATPPTRLLPPHRHTDRPQHQGPEQREHVNH